MLHIFPTSRAIRSFYANFPSNSFLPKALSIADFEARAVLVLNLVKADEETRVFTMQEVCKFEQFKALHIPQEFLSFLKNSSYLFRFFEELSYEKKSCMDLRGADVYGEFEEHLAILSHVYESYVKLLEQKGFYDAITLPSLYKINEDFIHEHEQITFYIEGFLNGFEWELIKTLTKYSQVFIELHLNSYNQKMRHLFEKIGISLPKEGHFTINLNKKSFTTKELKTKPLTIETKAFSLRSLQIGYIFHQIDNMVKGGIAPEKIAVILPDEKFSQLLSQYDRGNNLNFAMGRPFSQTLFFQKLKALWNFLQEKSMKTKTTLQRLALEETKWQECWSQNIPFLAFKTMLLELDETLKKESLIILEKELYSLEKLSNHERLSVKELVKLLLNRLSTCSLDDSRGGQVTVMGVLETRGVSYEGVIIADFNDSFVPRFSQKDMFLSSKLRFHAKLPTSKDRENLQRYYYHRLIQKAKCVAISYVKNEEHLPSRFLQTLNTKEDALYHEDSYATFLFEKRDKKEFFTPQNLEQKNDFFSYPLSASRLKSFLECPRCYYFNYILNLEDEALPSEALSPRDIGDALHEALFHLYKKQNAFFSASELHEKLCYEIDTLKLPFPLWQLEKELWKEKLFSFCENEVKRFKNGWRVYKLEEQMRGKFCGIDIKGTIDRIDIHENNALHVIDYKSGKVSLSSQKQIDSMSSFQLQFYHLLASKFGEVRQASFYDLGSGKLVDETFMDEKLEKLQEVIEKIKAQKMLQFNYGEKSCTYSSFEFLCAKDRF